MHKQNVFINQFRINLNLNINISLPPSPNQASPVSGSAAPNDTEGENIETSFIGVTPAKPNQTTKTQKIKSVVHEAGLKL